MWEAMEKCNKRSAKEISSISKRGRSKMKGAWWWKEEVMDRDKEKKQAYVTFINSGIDEEKEVSRVRYKLAKKVAKKVVVAESMKL